MMCKRLDILFLFFIWSLGLISCGTGIGNPYSNTSVRDPAELGAMDNRLSPQAESFELAISAYTQDISPTQVDGQECGSFTESNTQAEVDQGRQCIRDALSACHVARYLINQDTVSGRFVSYVAVRMAENGGCEIFHHTVSTNPSLFYGESSKSCANLDAATLPELACIE